MTTPSGFTPLQAAQWLRDRIRGSIPELPESHLIQNPDAAAQALRIVLLATRTARRPERALFYLATARIALEQHHGRRL